jgi:integrase/recombinase XerD
MDVPGRILPGNPKESAKDVAPVPRVYPRKETLKDFKTAKGIVYAPAVRGFARYLFAQKRVPAPLTKPVRKLVAIYEDYLDYQRKIRQISSRQIQGNRRVLIAFHDYLEKSRIELSSLKIEHVDGFLAEFFAGFAPETCRAYRLRLRGFLRYLFRERRLLKRDLSPLVVGRRLYAQAKPPRFFRPKEIQKLFAGLKLASSSEIRTYAIVHLAYMLGLRPREIASITLDDLSLSQGELTLRVRKNGRPLKLPLPEPALKAIAAYLIGARPKSPRRNLFLTLHPPYRPIIANTATYCIRKAMKKEGLSGSAYGLRHTFAQNLLENAVSIFEIKEMLGHDRIESTKNYLRVHIRLMREVILGETL